MLPLLLLSFSLSLFANVSHDQLAYSPKWLKLGHYKKTLLGGYESQADGADFFLHPEGKRDPKKELERSIELFSKSGTPKDGDAACRFPARLKWLNGELGNPWKIDLSGCQKYIGFFSKVAAKRASIVFSSYYLGNPNSAFGHTLLRLSRFEERSETEMLDYGINYAAQSQSSNPFSYAYNGLFGGFKGKFTAIPYYYKVREYSDYEFRDLWSFELNLDMRQVLELVDHVWELGQTYFDYFYFQENCSYHLLSLIEVVAPEKDLTTHFDYYTIPADTVRLLKKEGLIKEGTRRESTYSRLMRLSEKLDEKDLRLAKEIAAVPVSANAKVAAHSNERAAGVLDVAMEAFDYQNVEKILKDDPQTKEVKSHILLARAKNPIISGGAPKDDFLHESPSISHGPTRVSLSEGYEEQHGKFTKLESRFALHDLLDQPQGSLKDGQLEMGRISLNYKEWKYDEAKVRLQEFSVLSMRNYPEQNFWANPISWEIEAGARALPRSQCFDCPETVLMAGVGNSLQLWQKRILLAILLNGEFNLQNFYEHGYRIGLGPKFVSRFFFTEKWGLLLSGWQHYNTYRFDEIFSDHDYIGEAELRHHLSIDLSLFIKYQKHTFTNQRQEQSEFGLRYLF